ncbi:MAG: radical SAM protein [Candidatus Cyclobacteriaceae bacterium M2_1C_046]
MRIIHHPVLCNYYVTYRCNATCGFCDIWERPSPYITLENAAHNFRDLKKLGVKVIDFTGGEPLLHRQIDALLAMAKGYGFITTLTTNGLLYPKWSKKIAGLVDMLHFSLDYGTAEKHDKARGVACFDKVMESIDIALALGERPDILFTAFEENLDEIDPVYTICQQHNLVLILNPAFSYNEVGNNLKNAGYLEKLGNWSKKKGVYLNKAFLELRKNGGNKVDDPVCKAASSTIVISPENNLVLPCYHLGIKEYPIDNKLFTLFKSKEINELIKMEGRYPGCEGCTINCYMQPSFAVNLSKYWLMALPSTIKYNSMKGTWKYLFRRKKNFRNTSKTSEKINISLPY